MTTRKLDPKPAALRSLKTSEVKKLEPKKAAAGQKLTRKNDEFSTGMAKALRMKSLGSTANVMPASTVLNPAAAVSVDASQKKVEDAYKRGGAKAAAVALEKEVMALSPADAAKLMKAVAPVVEQIVKDSVKGNKDDTNQTITSLAHAASLAGPEATAAVATQIAAVITEKEWKGGFDFDVGNFEAGFNAAIAAGAGPQLALATQAALKAAGKLHAADAIGSAALSAVQKPIEEYEAASNAYAMADAQLAQNLAEQGAGLSDTERAAYIEGYWADSKNAPIKAAFEAAEAKLASQVEHNREGLEAAALAGDTKAAAALLKGMTALANTPNHAKAAMDWVAELGKPGNKALFDALNTDGKLEQKVTDEILAPALGNAQSKAITDGSMDDVLATLKTIKSLGKNFTSLPGEISGALETINKVNELLKQGLSGREALAKLRFEGLADGFEGKSKFGKALAVFTVVNGIVKAGDATGGIEQFKAAFESIGAGLELTAGVLGTLGRAGKLVGAEKAGALISKYLPGVAFAADGLQLVQDIQELVRDGSAGDYIATVGTVVNLLGDVAGVFPVLGTAVDGVLTTVGSILQGLGSLVDSIIHGGEKAEELAEDRRRYLEAAGVDPKTIDLLMSGTYVELSALSQMGLSKDQFLEVIRGSVELFEKGGEKAVRDFQIAWGAAAAYGYTGTDAVKFAKELQTKLGTLDSGSDAYVAIRNSLDNLKFSVTAADLNGGTEAQVEELAEDALTSFTGALGWLGDFVVDHDLDLKDDDPSILNVPFFVANDQHE